MDLSNRSYTLIAAPNAVSHSVLSGLDMSALDVAFKVKKTLKPKPNTANIKVWGLGDDSRCYLAADKLNVRLEAGYGGENELLFLGQTRNSYSRIEGPEIVTYLETGDSEIDLASAGLTQTFTTATSVKDAVKALLSTLPTQASSSFATDLDNFLSGSTLALKLLHNKGGAVDRQTSRHLTDLCRSAGLEWSIQNGNLLVLPKGGTIAGKEISLSSSSGMIGSPSVDHKGQLEVKSLIIPGLHPGVQVSIDSTNVKGSFRIESAEYVGDTSVGARDWYVKLTCEKKAA